MHFLIILVWVFVTSSAWASCFIAERPPSEKIQILETWKARHVREGLLDGCILRIQFPDNLKSYAYTAYGFICDLKQSESIEISRQTACCDTGDAGDFSCGVKPVNPLTGVPQIWDTLIPAHPDKRAIPDLMRSLENSGFRAQHVAKRLLEYEKIPELKSEILKFLPRLKELLNSSKSVDLKAAVSQLLMQVDSSPGDEVELNLSILKSTVPPSEFQQHNALVVLSRHPESAEKIIPTLIELLRRSYKARDRQLVMSAIMSLGVRAKPFLSQIHHILSEELKQNIVSTQSLWNELVCGALPLSHGSKASRVLWGGYEKLTPVECPFSGVSARESLDKRKDPNVSDGSGVRAWIF